MKKFDASVPRKMFWSTEVGDTDFCPQCHGRLENENHSYLLLVMKQGDFQSFIIGNNYGYFCAQCPIVVLDCEAFTEVVLEGSHSSSRSVEFTVIGILDIYGVPQEKSDILIDNDDNPIPLVKFTNLRDKKSSERWRSKATKDRRRKSHHNNKRRWNSNVLEKG